MNHPERVEDCLEHIVEAIERAAGYLQPIPDLEAFKTNLQVQDAVVRNIEIVGEAVNQVNTTDTDFVEQHPEVPWAQMRRVRNIAIHEYIFVDLGIVWTTVKDDFPKLKLQIEASLQR